MGVTYILYVTFMVLLFYRKQKHKELFAVSYSWWNEVLGSHYPFMEQGEHTSWPL